MTRWKLLLALLLGLVAVAEAASRNPAYYGTRRATSARQYSGEYQATQPNVVPTFSLPVYGGGYVPYRSRFSGGFYYPAYQQPLVIYPPVYWQGF